MNRVTVKTCAQTPTHIQMRDSVSIHSKVQCVCVCVCVCACLLIADKDSLTGVGELTPEPVRGRIYV